jgi:hypothetical protein
VSPAAIRAEDLRLVLAAIKASRYLDRPLARFAAVTPGSLLTVGCHEAQRWPETTAMGRRLWAAGTRSPVRFTPMQRGDMARLYERVAREHGRSEVLKTWGQGIRSLQAEPRHCLHRAA